MNLSGKRGASGASNISGKSADKYINEMKVDCPFCKTSNIEHGSLHPKVGLGALNFFGGFSAGTKVNLYWAKTEILLKAEPIVFKRSLPAYKCQSCNTIIFSPELGKSNFFVPEWLKILIVVVFVLGFTYVASNLIRCAVGPI